MSADTRLQRIYSDIAQLLVVLRKMQDEATAVGYRGLDLRDIGDLLRSFSEDLPRLQKAAFENDPQAAIGPMYSLLGAFRALFVDGSFGEWSKIWNGEGSHLMAEAVRFSREETKALEAARD